MASVITIDGRDIQTRSLHSPRMMRINVANVNESWSLQVRTGIAPLFRFRGADSSVPHMLDIPPDGTSTAPAFPAANISPTMPFGRFLEPGDYDIDISSLLKSFLSVYGRSAIQYIVCVEGSSPHDTLGALVFGMPFFQFHFRLAPVLTNFCVVNDVVGVNDDMIQPLSAVLNTNTSEDAHIEAVNLKANAQVNLAKRIFGDLVYTIQLKQISDKGMYDLEPWLKYDVLCPIPIPTAFTLDGFLNGTSNIDYVILNSTSGNNAYKMVFKQASTYPFILLNKVAGPLFDYDSFYTDVLLPPSNFYIGTSGPIPGWNYQMTYHRLQHKYRPYIDNQIVLMWVTKFGQPRAFNFIAQEVVLSNTTKSKDLVKPLTNAIGTTVYSGTASMGVYNPVQHVVNTAAFLTPGQRTMKVTVSLPVEDTDEYRYISTINESPVVFIVLPRNSLGGFSVQECTIKKSNLPDTQIIEDLDCVSTGLSTPDEVIMEIETDMFYL